MKSLLDILRDTRLVDAGVLALGLERGWASRADVSAYAVEKLSADDERVEAVELATAEELDPDRIVELLRGWARIEHLPFLSAEEAIRRWMFAALMTISESGASADEKLDRLEEAYATFGYPEEMRECSRYYVPPRDRARGIRVGDVTASPLEAMNQLLSRLRTEFGIR